MSAAPTRHESMVAMATSLAHGSFATIGWANAADGKAPKTRWKADATDDPALVPKLLHGSRNALVIPRGRAIIIDIDVAGAWAELEAAGLPPTLTIDSPTPDHGHVYGWVPESIDMATIPGTFSGGEIRRYDPKTGTASMVLGPWALRRDGVYTPRPDARTIATLPASVIEYLIASARREDMQRAAARGPQDVGWKIAKGRHDWLKSRGRWLRGNGLSGPRLLDELRRLDRDRCDPPLADVPGRGDPEIVRIADWIEANIADDKPGVTLVLGDAGKPPAHLTRQSRAAWYFAQIAGDRVRFDHGRGRWLIWAGHRWRPDEDGAVERLWLAVLADRYRDALTIGDNDIRVKALDAIQSAGATNAAVSAGLELASSMTPIATKADAWDPDPWALGCENGVVDLRTGELRPGRPTDMISRSTGIAYDPNAVCPRWAQFLTEVFAGDKALVDWYGLLIGTSLVGEVQELLAIHHGLGNNGKSVGVRALRHAIGDYAVTIPVETLINARRSAGEATPDLMTLRGARIAFTSEPDQSAKLRGGVLKRLATIDRMTGRSLFGQTQTWDPTHSVNLMTNHLPAVDDATEGFWRRVALVPWTVCFRKPGESGSAPPEDPGLAAKLAAEGPGILAWAVRGAVAYAGGKTLHPFPDRVRVRTAAYRADEDKLGAFVAERITYDPGASIAVGALFAEYKAWCEAQSVPPFERLGQKLFARGFEERGHGVGRATGRWALFTGVRLADEHEMQALQASEAFAGSSEIPLHIEGSGKYPQVPAMPAEDESIDLWAEAQRIFADDLATPA